MKKALALLLAIVLTLSLVACGSTASSTPAATSGSTAASAAPDTVYTIKFAYTQGDMDREESAEIMYAELFKEYCEANSNGALKVELYPSGQLGTAAEAIQGVVANNIEMACVNITMLNSIYADSMALSCPGLFASEEECDKVLAGDWANAFYKDMAEKTSVKMLTAISNGFRCFTSSKKELTTVDTAKGVVWRVMDSPVYIKMVEALGAKAVPMAGSEMYTAMQNGTVDGQENPVVNILNDKTYEVQKYLVLDKHVASIVTFIMSDKFFASLPADLQTVVMDAAAQATPEAQRVVKQINTDGLTKLAEYGMSIYEPTAEELEAWHAAIADPCQTYVRGELGDEVMDNLLAAIEAARA